MHTGDGFMLGLDEHFFGEASGQPLFRIRRTTGVLRGLIKAVFNVVTREIRQDRELMAIIPASEDTSAASFN